MERKIPLKEVKMKMYGYEFAPDDIPESFEERVNYLREIGRKADKEFKEKYKDIASWFNKYDSVYLLSFCAIYFLAHEDGYDEEWRKDTWNSRLTFKRSFKLFRFIMIVQSLQSHCLMKLRNLKSL